MTVTGKKPHQYPFFVRQAGLDYARSTEAGAIKGFNTEAEANADKDDRNKRAKDLGVKARYEVLVL